MYKIVIIRSKVMSLSIIGQVIPCLEMVRRVTVSLNIGVMLTALEGGEGGEVRGLTDMKVSELRLLMRYC